MIKHHEHFRQQNLTSSNKDIKKLYDTLKESILSTKVLEQFPNISISSSLGSGNVRSKPIIYFYDKRETKTGTIGKYVALVLPNLKDREKDYFVKVSFTQGIDKLSEHLNSKSKAKNKLAIDANLISTDYEYLFNRNEIDLAHCESNMGVSIAQKIFITEKDTSDESILTTLKVLLNGLTTYCDYESEYLDENEDENEDDHIMIGKYKVRNGQSKFKKLLIQNRKGCMVTGIKTINALDAAHIVPHALATNYSFDNGLLLRKDIHKLYDDKLLKIDEDGIIHISSDIDKNEVEYFQYNGKKIIGEISSQMSQNLLANF